MSKSAIYTVNTAAQSLSAGSSIALGGVVRRFGCNLSMTGSGIALSGLGYYKIDAAVTVAPTEIGTVTVSMLKDGIPVPGAVATAQATAAGQALTVPITAIVRESCCCDPSGIISFVIGGADAAVSAIAVTAFKL